MFIIIVLEFHRDSTNRSQKYRQCILRKESKVVKTLYLEDKLFPHMLIKIYVHSASPNIRNAVLCSEEMSTSLLFTADVKTSCRTHSPEGLNIPTSFPATLNSYFLPLYVLRNYPSTCILGLPIACIISMLVFTEKASSEATPFFKKKKKS